MPTLSIIARSILEDELTRVLALDHTLRHLFLVDKETGILTKVDTYNWITFLPMSDGGGAYNRYFGRLNICKMKIRGVVARKATPQSTSIKCSKKSSRFWPGRGA